MGSMHTKSPGHDEQREGTQVSYSSQRRRRAISERRPMGEYYPDEHPEIPLMARASRLKAQNTNAAPQEQDNPPSSSYRRSTPAHRSRGRRRGFLLQDALQSLHSN